MTSTTTYLILVSAGLVIFVIILYYFRSGIPKLNFQAPKTLDKGIDWSSAINFHRNRRKRAKTLDEKNTHSKVLSYPTEGWRKKPGNYDVQGIDTPDSNKDLRKTLSDIKNRRKYQWADSSKEYEVGLHENKKYVVKKPQKEDEYGDKEPGNPAEDIKKLKRLNKKGIAPQTLYLPRENVLVQKFIDGRRANNEEIDKMEEAARREGFIPQDLHTGNVIVDNKTGKEYIIDVGYFGDDPRYKPTGKKKSK